MGDRDLAVIGGRVARVGGRLLMHSAFGRLVEAFAGRYRRVHLSAPLLGGGLGEADYPLPENVSLYPQPPWRTTAEGIRHGRGIRRACREAIEQGDEVFVRGNPLPATTSLYAHCARLGRPVCHWVVGNPMELLRSHRRANPVADALARLYVRQWEARLRAGQRRARGALLCNGDQLAQRYRPLRAYPVVSTTLTEADFFERVDTCAGEPVNLLSLCYIRPEKGIEYLVEAAAVLARSRGIRLTLAGSRERYPRYQQRLDALIEEAGLADSVRWLGHVPFAGIPALMREADLFVLPSLSEGTPRVLLEARACGVPVVSTDVGGIPSSVLDGHDGLLVPPRDAGAIARAVERIVADPVLRQGLIRNGYGRARRNTIERFVARVEGCFQELRGEGR